jgi:hypothetical protein
VPKVLGLLQQKNKIFIVRKKLKSNPV